MSAYVIRGGTAGRERLRVIARTMHPTTSALLDRFQLPPGARCWDVGCGGGDVTRELARRYPGGWVVGTDVDEVKVAIAREEVAEAGFENVELRQASITATGTGAADVASACDLPSDCDLPSGCDLVYARFLLSHLADPAAALEVMIASLAPGGVLVIEDVDMRGAFCHPPNMAFDRQRAIYDQTVRASGGDPFLGGRLPRLLRSAGLRDVGVHMVQPVAMEGELKTIPALTLSAVSEAALGHDIARADEIVRTLEQLVEYAARPDTLIALPRIVQSWGYKPG
jgi:SAM-dependent methyltransferase